MNKLSIRLFKYFKYVIRLKRACSYGLYIGCIYIITIRLYT